MARCPFAVQDEISPPLGPYLGGEFRIVHFATESDSYSRARDGYVRGSRCPHFTVDEGRIYQHIDTVLAAHCLPEDRDTLLTNRLSAVQVAVMGYSGRARSARVLENLARLCRWLESTHGISTEWPARGLRLAGNGKRTGSAPDADTWTCRGGHYTLSEVPGSAGVVPCYEHHEVETLISKCTGPAAAESDPARPEHALELIEQPDLLSHVPVEAGRAVVTVLFNTLEPVAVKIEERVGDTARLTAEFRASSEAIRTFDFGSPVRSRPEVLHGSRKLVVSGTLGGEPLPIVPVVAGQILGVGLKTQGEHGTGERRLGPHHARVVVSVLDDVASSLGDSAECLRVHLKILAEPLVPVAEMVSAMQEVYGTAGIRTEVVSTEHLDLPELADVDVGACVRGQTTDEQNSLFEHRKGVKAGEVVVYLVRSTVPPYNGCAAHPPGKPGAVVVSGATRWTLAHELGHVLGLGHVDDNDRLMTGNGTGNITNPPPDLAQDEVKTIQHSSLTRSC